MFKFKKKESLTFRDTKSYKCGLEEMRNIIKNSSSNYPFKISWYDMGGDIKIKDLIDIPADAKDIMHFLAEDLKKELNFKIIDSHDNAIIGWILVIKKEESYEYKRRKNG